MGSILSEQPPPPPLHVVIFPFMAKGHTIPLLHFSSLLRRHYPDLTITIFTTPSNRPFISATLSATLTTTNTSIITLPYPEGIPGLPPGVESTDKLPSMSLFPTFAISTKLLQPSFERALKSLENVTFLVSDGFLHWTLESASKFGIPRLVFYGMSNHAMALTHDVTQNRGFYRAYSCDEKFELKSFPWITITKSDFDPVFIDPDVSDPYFQFVSEAVNATSKSYGLITNSFLELESVFLDFWNSNSDAKSWCVGPLCLADKSKKSDGSQFQFQDQDEEKQPKWMKWLDKKRKQGFSVLYIAFGSQAEMSAAQWREITIGLEESEVNFMWVVRESVWEVINGDDPGFTERVKNRGLVVKDWVNQREILEHECVEGFLSHCGWNSVIESICAKVCYISRFTD